MKFVFALLVLIYLPSCSNIAKRSPAQTHLTTLLTSPINILMEQAKSNVKYQITAENSRCPKNITLTPADQNNHEDLFYIYMQGTDSSGAHINFPYEGETFPIRLNLEPNKVHKKRGTQYIQGLAYSSRSQFESNDLLSITYTYRILSLILIDHSYYNISFSRKDKKITYTFKSRGIEDTICSYKEK